MAFSSQFKCLLALHLLLLFYSLGNVCSKIAASHPFFSIAFVVWYLGMLFILGAYALGWQQILKRMPLTSAFSNRAITVVWGVVWGALFFGEPITPLKIIGAAVIICGVVLFAHADKGSSKTETSANEPNIEGAR